VFIKDNKQNWSISLMAEVLKVSEQGYYKYGYALDEVGVQYAQKATAF
jgi:hypothetical protein